MFDFNEQFRFSEADRDMTDAWGCMFFINQQARKRNEAWVQMNPNQRSEQGQKFIKQLKEQAEDTAYEEVHL